MESYIIWQYDLLASSSYIPIELQDMGTSLESSDDKHLDEKHELHAVSVREIDTAAEVAAGEHDALDPEEALRVR